VDFAALRNHPPARDEHFHLDVVPDVVEKALHRLDAREREVVRRRFGLGGQHVQTLEEIGDALHLSRERIRQIERLALEKMKKQEALQTVYEQLD
jgi:RNA polymerase primary sigma factor